MRTTVNLPDDIYEIIRSIAVTQRISFGEALSVLVRAGLNPAPHIQIKAAFPHFAVDADAQPITLERTLEVEDEL